MHWVVILAADAACMEHCSRFRMIFRLMAGVLDVLVAMRKFS
jgi:hypothetical protein